MTKGVTFECIVPGNGVTEMTIGAKELVLDGQKRIAIDLASIEQVVANGWILMLTVGKERRMMAFSPASLAKKAAGAIQRAALAARGAAPKKPAATKTSAGTPKKATSAIEDVARLQLGKLDLGEGLLRFEFDRLTFAGKYKLTATASAVGAVKLLDGGGDRHDTLTLFFRVAMKGAPKDPYQPMPILSLMPLRRGRRWAKDLREASTRCAPDAIAAQAVLAKETAAEAKKALAGVEQRKAATGD